MNICFVCHGNLNRSAAAHLLAKEWFNSEHVITSCGVGKDAGKGSTAKKTRDSLLRKFELEAKPLPSTKASDELFASSDIIFYMDNANLKRLTENFPTHLKKFVSLGSLIGLGRIDDPGFISDPLKVDEVITQVGKAVWKFKTMGYPSASKLLSSVTINVTPPRMTEKKPKKEKPLMEGYLPITKFGRQLLESNDLDPIYCMLVDAKLKPDTLKRWLLAYTCYYHAGVASKCAEKEETFYKRLQQGHDEKWPRGSERRHFRGHTSQHVISFLQSTYPNPSDAVNYIVGSDSKPRTFQVIAKRLGKWKYFGPWITFKWADVIDRVLKKPVDFSDCSMNLYESPRKGAELIAKLSGKEMTVDQVLAKLEAKFSSFQAPPLYDRPVNVQEVETILCKWKSHTSGHYPVGKDIKEIRHNLEGWGSLADHLVKFLPKDFKA